MAPETNSMAELMQGGGLERRLGLAWADQHQHLGFKAPLAVTLNPQQS
jgi:hypothetical protein